MKIDIVNFVYGNNYGAVLQAYALQEILLRQNHNVSTIRYVYKSKNLFKNICKYIIKIIVCNLYRSQNVFKYINNQRFIQKIYDIKAQAPFDHFRTRFIFFNANQCSSLRDYAILPCQDAVICGSDVVWTSYDYSPNIDIYFLSWVQRGVMRVAYAPSWGRPNITHLNHETKQKISLLLSLFDAVSVREKSGVDICASLGRTDVQWVPDPTMLLTDDDWNQIAESRFYGSYILNYHIPFNKSVDDTNILSVIEQYYNVPIQKVPDINSKYVWLSPTEWLGSIRDAEFVVTNSFHGVVFCIIYNKKFLFTKLTGEHEMLNERIYSLLDLFELNERIVTEEVVSNVDSIKLLIESPIDWEKVNEKLKWWRQIGINFLKKALKNHKQE